jgi:hypothetical protein
VGDRSDGAEREHRALAQPLDRDALAAAVGSVAVAATPSGPLRLVIRDVSPLLVQGPYESFSVLLLGPPERIEQATYPMTHPELGRFDLFMVPVAAEDGGIVYEAVFNRPVEAPAP